MARFITGVDATICQCAPPTVSDSCRFDLQWWSLVRCLHYKEWFLGNYRPFTSGIIIHVLSAKPIKTGTAPSDNIMQVLLRIRFHHTRLFSHFSTQSQNQFCIIWRITTSLPSWKLQLKKLTKQKNGLQAKHTISLRPFIHKIRIFLHKNFCVCLFHKHPEQHKIYCRNSSNIDTPPIYPDNPFRMQTFDCYLFM